MQSKDLEIFKQLLLTSGHSLTKSRLIIFSDLLKTGPSSIAEVQKSTKGKLDRVSVYRNLALFEQLGIVRKLYIGWKYKYELTDKFTTHHHHLTCLSCGQIIDIQDEKHINSFIDKVTKQFNFRPQTHQFEIDGYCAKCSRRQ